MKKFYEVFGMVEPMPDPNWSAFEEDSGNVSDLIANPELIEVFEAEEDAIAFFKEKAKEALENLIDILGDDVSYFSDMTEKERFTHQYKDKDKLHKKEKREYFIGFEESPWSKEWYIFPYDVENCPWILPRLYLKPVSVHFASEKEQS